MTETKNERKYRLSRAYEAAGATYRAAKNAIDYLNDSDHPSVVALAYETMRAARSTYEALAKELA